MRWSGSGCERNRAAALYRCLRMAASKMAMPVAVATRLKLAWITTLPPTDRNSNIIGCPSTAPDDPVPIDLFCRHDRRRVSERVPAPEPGPASRQPKWQGLRRSDRVDQPPALAPNTPGPSRQPAAKIARLPVSMGSLAGQGDILR